MAEQLAGKNRDVGTKLQLRPDERPTRHQKPRLAREDYVGQRTYHIMLPTAQRAPILEDIDLSRRFEDVLVDCSNRLEFSILAYCFMPDHLHVLLRGSQPTSDLLKFVQRFKQRTGFYFKSVSGDRPWQQSFFDRVLRQDNDISEVDRYIFENPSAEGFPGHHPAYLLRGGNLFAQAGPDGAEASSLHSGLASSSNGTEGASEQPA